VVAYVYAGVRLRRASIVPTRGALGHTVVYDSWGIQAMAGVLDRLDDESQRMVRAAQRVRFERVVIAILAGGLAERRFTGCESSFADEDRARAEYLTASFAGPEREADEYLAVLHLEADLLVLRLWPHVEAVARELLERRTIEDDDYFNALEAEVTAGPPRY
jgi:hypothetical protein